MKLKNLLFLILILAVLSAVASIFLGTEEKEKSDSYPEVQEQASIQRKFETRNFVLRWRIKNYMADSEKKLLYYVWGLDINKRNEIYAMDFGRQAILKFDSTGKFVTQFGQGKGGGPGEFRNMSGFSVDEYNRVWVCDPALNRISCFNAHGILEFDFSPSMLVSRVGYFKNKIIVKVAQISLPLFAILNQDGSVERNFGRIHELQEKDTKIAFDGPVVINDQGIYAFFFKMPFFVKFNHEGEIVYFRRTIGDYAMPVVHTKNIGGQIARWVDKSAPWITITASVDIEDGKIFLLSTPLHKGGKSVIDVYSEVNGEYQYSFELPEKVRIAKIRHSIVYASQDTLISSWRISR